MSCSNEGTLESDNEMQKIPIPQPPANYSWKRPTLLRKGCYVNLYTQGLPVLAKKIPKIFKKFGGDDQLERFKSGVLGRLLDMRRGRNATMPLHYLIARQLEGDIPKDEKWFYVAGQTVRFTPKEYAMITGLNFGPSEFDPYASTHQIPRSSIYYTYFEGKATKVEQLKKKFFNKELGSDVQNYFKAANLLVYYDCLLCRTDDVYVDDWAWTLVEDVEAWNRFPWGAYTYGVLCHYIERPYMKRVTERYHFYGPVWVFQIWSYEAIPALGKKCGVQDRNDILPRCFRWSSKLDNKTDYKYFFDDPKLKISPLAPTDEELVMPYMKFVGNDLAEMFTVRYKPPPRGIRYKKRKTIAGAESLKRRRWERTVSSDTDETGHSEHGEQERSEANDHTNKTGHSGQPNTQGEDIESRMRTVLFDDSPTGVLALLVQKIGDRFENRQHEQSALLVQKIDDRINQWFERRQHEQSALLDQKIDDRINQWFERRQHEQSALLDQKIDDRIDQWFERRQHEQSASHHSVHTQASTYHSAREEVHIPTETKLDVDSSDRRGRDEVHIPTETMLDVDSRGCDEVLHIPIETKLDVDSTDRRGCDKVHIPTETKLDVESTDRRGALALSGRDVVDISSDESELDFYSSDESEASFFVKKSAAVHFPSDENRCAACSSMKVEPMVFIQMKKKKKEKKKKEKEKKKIKVEAHSQCD